MLPRSTVTCTLLSDGIHNLGDNVPSSEATSASLGLLQINDVILDGSLPLWGAWLGEMPLLQALLAEFIFTLETLGDGGREDSSW